MLKLQNNTSQHHSLPECENAEPKGSVEFFALFRARVYLFSLFLRAKSNNFKQSNSFVTQELVTSATFLLLNPTPGVLTLSVH